MRAEPTVVSAVAAANGGMAPRVFRVERAHRETPDTWTLAIEPDDGAAKPDFAPGQFNMLYAFGRGESAISLSGDAAVDGPWLHTIRAVGPVTRALCALRRGGRLGVRGPFGTAWPVDETAGKDVLIVAGGIGLAPLRPALYHLLAHRERYGRVALLYGAREPDGLLFLDELRAWRGRLDLDVEVTVDHARADWRGHVGVVTRLLAFTAFDPDETAAFVCGPEVMMRFAAAELCDRGVASESVYVSMERSMKCGVGHCGHCQLGPELVCRDGPVFSLREIEPLLHSREV